MSHMGALSVTTERGNLSQTKQDYKINYPEDCGMPTADVFVIKLLPNSVISTPNVKFMTMDIKISYHNTPLKKYEYLQLKLADIPEEYELAEKAADDGWECMLKSEK